MHAVANRLRPCLVPILAVIPLGLTASLPWLQPDGAAAIRAVQGNLPRTIAITIGAVIIVAAVALSVLLPMWTAARAAAASGLRLLLHLWPVILLTVAYPAATSRMAGHRVGGVELTTLLLAVAVIVPWLVQGTCTPLYRAVGGTECGEVQALRRRFCAVWPAALLQSAPLLGVSAVPAALILHWSAPAIRGFVLLVGLNVLFAQVLVIPNLTRSRVAWTLSWTAYALPILVVPTVWYLPPLSGLLTQLVPLCRHIGVKPVWLSFRKSAVDMSDGLLSGSIMWSDKALFFYCTAGHFPVRTVFLALFPAVLAYTYYFVCAAPRVESSMARLHDAMRSASLGDLGDRSRGVARVVSTSVSRTAVLGAMLTSASSWLLALAYPQLDALIASASLAAWLFAMVTVLCYKLELVSERWPGRVIGALHVILCTTAFLLLPLGSPTYWAVFGGEAMLCIGVFVVFRQAWRRPEYTIFWRKALAW